MKNQILFAVKHSGSDGEARVKLTLLQSVNIGLEHESVIVSLRITDLLKRIIDIEVLRGLNKAQYLQDGEEILCLEGLSIDYDEVLIGLNRGNKSILRSSLEEDEDNDENTEEGDE